MRHHCKTFTGLFLLFLVLLLLPRPLEANLAAAHAEGVPMLSPLHVACRACSHCTSPSHAEAQTRTTARSSLLEMQSPRLTAPDVCFMLDAPVPPAPVASSKPPSPLGPVAKVKIMWTPMDLQVCKHMTRLPDRKAHLLVRRRGLSCHPSIRTGPSRWGPPGAPGSVTARQASLPTMLPSMQELLHVVPG